MPGDFIKNLAQAKNLTTGTRQTLYTAPSGTTTAVRSCLLSGNISWTDSSAARPAGTTTTYAWATLSYATAAATTTWYDFATFVYTETYQGSGLSRSQPVQNTFSGLLVLNPGDLISITQTNNLSSGSSASTSISIIVCGVEST